VKSSRHRAQQAGQGAEGQDRVGQGKGTEGKGRGVHG
jgi:hypothetical protein